MIQHVRADMLKRFYNLKYTIFISILSLTLVGCGTIKPTTVVEIKKEPVVIPEELLKLCTVTKPPEHNSYIKASVEKRESMLTDTIISLYMDLGNCNSQINEIKAFQDRQLKLIKDNQDEINKQSKS